MLEVDDDPKTLCALLDALDEALKAHTDGQDDSNEESHRCTCSHNRTAKKKRGISSFARQRHQILDLQQEIHRLEGVLAAQKQHRAISLVHSERQKLWKAIALRQRRAQERAEAECAALRGYMAARFRLEDGNARAILAGAGYQVPRPLNVDVLRIPVDEAFARLHHLSQHTHVAFAAQCFSDGSQNFNHVEMMNNSTEETVIDCRNAWVLPFSLDQVHRSLWTYMNRMNMMIPDPDYQTDQLTTDDSVVNAYFFQAKMNDPAFQARDMTKNFRLEDDSNVIVTTFQAESIDSIDDQLSMYEILWFRVRDLSTDEENPLTQVQMSMRTSVQSRNAQVLAKGVRDISWALGSEAENFQAMLETLLLTAQSSPSSA